MFLVAYLFLQLGLCYFISKKIKTENDYFVGGHRFPMWVVAISLFATWFGAETSIGSSAAVFESGLSGSRADPFGYSICLFLSGVLIAGKIWSKNYITLSDFYKERFGTGAEQVAVWLLSISSLIWGAAQLRAFGHVISSVSNLDYNLTLKIGFAFVVAYTFFGGLIGDVITDVIQAVVIVLGLCCLLGIIFWHTPDTLELFKQIPPERLSFFATGESWLKRLDRWSIPILGSLVAQEIVSRLFSAQNKSVAVKACYAGGLIYLLVGIIPIVIGLLGPQLIQIESGVETETFLIQVAKKYLSPAMIGIFCAAIMSALLSTIDSIILAVGALVSHNFIIPRFKITNSKTKLLTSRLVVLGAALAAYILAVHSTGIYDLLETSSTFGTAGILVITLAGLWCKWGNNTTALLTLFAGIISVPLFKYIFHNESPFIMSLLVSALVFFIHAYLYKIFKFQKLLNR